MKRIIWVVVILLLLLGGFYASRYFGFGQASLLKKGPVISTATKPATIGEAPIALFAGTQAAPRHGGLGQVGGSLGAPGEEFQQGDYGDDEWYGGEGVVRYYRGGRGADDKNTLGFCFTGEDTAEGTWRWFTSANIPASQCVGDYSFWQDTREGVPPSGDSAAVHFGAWYVWATHGDEETFTDTAEAGDWDDFYSSTFEGFKGEGSQWMSFLDMLFASGRWGRQWDSNEWGHFFRFWDQYFQNVGNWNALYEYVRNVYGNNVPYLNYYKDWCQTMPVYLENCPA